MCGHSDEGEKGGQMDGEEDGQKDGVMESTPAGCESTSQLPTADAQVGHTGACIYSSMVTLWNICTLHYIHILLVSSVQLQTPSDRT